MVSNAYRKILCILSLALLLLPTSCSSNNTQQVSENAEKVITAVFNTPNIELFNDSMITTLGQTLTDELQAKQSAERSQILSNWKSAVGECFSEGSFDSFMGSSLALKYHTTTALTGNTTKVHSMNLVSRDDSLEKVNVELLVNDEIQQVVVLFRKNPDNLFYAVELAQ